MSDEVTDLFSQDLFLFAKKKRKKNFGTEEKKTNQPDLVGVLRFGALGGGGGGASSSAAAASTSLRLPMDVRLFLAGSGGGVVCWGLGGATGGVSSGSAPGGGGAGLVG